MLDLGSNEFSHAEAPQNAQDILSQLLLLREIDDVIKKVQDDLLRRRIDGSHWDFHAHLGTHFISQYLLFTAWCDQKKTLLDMDHLKSLLLSSQLSDGSWKQLPDANIESGDLNATIFNYWALKAMGESAETPLMNSARDFILRKGGIESSALFTKIILALFGNYDWKNITYTPYLIFVESFPSNYKEFAQWVIPHLLPISYLRHNRVSKNLGPSFEVFELHTKLASPAEYLAPKSPVRYLDGPIIKRLLSTQQEQGTWGGYSLSTLLGSVALLHYDSHLTRRSPRIRKAVDKGIAFVEKLYFSSGEGSYQGALMDGKNWDTILIGNSLIESGVDPKLLQPTFDFVSRLQQPTGGIPYGDDFEYAPDTDDTAEAIMFLSHQPRKYSRALQSAVEWLCSMQNSEGGWGAFDRDNVGNPLLRHLTKSYHDSVDLFDDSSADIVGHVLESLGRAGMTNKNSDTVRRAIGYLRKTQNANGTWTGRWGVNYIFGTSCAVSGLLKIGEKSSSPMIERALTWLLSKQNLDGGWGESVHSYDDEKLAGVGRSSPTQTAWVLSTLISAGFGLSPQVKFAAAYLVSDFNKNGEWIDTTVVGTGHPGLLYMNYPSYARAFPLLALSQYRQALRNQEVLQAPTQRVSSFSFALPVSDKLSL